MIQIAAGMLCELKFARSLAFGNGVTNVQPAARYGFDKWHFLQQVQKGVSNTN